MENLIVLTLLFSCVSIAKCTIILEFKESLFKEGRRVFLQYEKLSGGAEIYKVFDQEKRMFLFLKFQLKADKHKSFLRNEFEALKMLGAFTTDDSVPPTLPRVYGYGKTEDGKWEALLMEYFEQGDMFDFIKTEEFRLKSGYFIARFGLQIMTFFLHAKTKGLIHGDLKLENILVDTNVYPPRIVVIDLGNSTYPDCPLKYHIKGTLAFASLRIHESCDSAADYASDTQMTASDDLDSFMFALMQLLNLHFPWSVQEEFKDKLLQFKSQIDVFNAELFKVIGGLPIQLDWSELMYRCFKKIGEMKQTNLVEGMIANVADPDFRKILENILQMRGKDAAVETFTKLKDSFHAKLHDEIQK